MYIKRLPVELSPEREHVGRPPPRPVNGSPKMLSSCGSTAKGGARVVVVMNLPDIAVVGAAAGRVLRGGVDQVVQTHLLHLGGGQYLDALHTAHKFPGKAKDAKKRK